MMCDKMPQNPADKNCFKKNMVILLKCEFSNSWPRSSIDEASTFYKYEVLKLRTPKMCVVFAVAELKRLVAVKTGN